MSMEHWKNNTDIIKQKYSERNLSQCHCVRHKPHIDWPGIEPWTQQWGDYLREPWSHPDFLRMICALGFALLRAVRFTASAAQSIYWLVSGYTCKRLSLIQNFHNSSGAHSWAPSLGQGGRVLKLTAHSHQISRLRMSGAKTPPLHTSHGVKKRIFHPKQSYLIWRDSSNVSCLCLNRRSYYAFNLICKWSNQRKMAVRQFE
jgi:hypothetical protein